MKVAIITDTHFGIRGDSRIMLEHQSKFFNEIFFPKLESEGIMHIIHPGDLVDRRKYINFNTHNVMRETFLDRINDDYEMHLLAGNHDVYYKTTNNLNALDELLKPYPNIIVYTEPKEINLCGYKLAMLPWINAENEDSSHKLIQNTKAQILFGHLELRGFEMFRGQLSDHGMESNILDKFDLVFSGHFHQKSTNGNIHYLGAPYQMTWSDWDCPRGFHILDLETREIEFIPNPYEMFVKVFYNDAEQSFKELMDFDKFDWRGCYIKVIVENKTNPFYFDQFIDKLEALKPADVRVVEPLTQADNSDIINQAEDTQTILMKTIDRLDVDIDKSKLKSLMSTLYTEAVNIDVDA